MKSLVVVSLLIGFGLASAPPGVAKTTSRDDEPGIRLVQPGLQGGGPITLATPERKVIQVNQAGANDGFTASVRNSAQEYIIGMAHEGWTFDKITSSQTKPWWKGWLYGDYNYCGWIHYDNAQPKAGTPTAHCETWTLAPSAFIANGGTATNDWSCDGCNRPKAVRLTAPAQLYGNAKPWSAGPTQRTNPYRGVLPTNSCVEWRYVTRNGQYVLVKDRSVPLEQGGWGFIPRSSLPTTLPTGIGPRCYPDTIGVARPNASGNWFFRFENSFAPADITVSGFGTVGDIGVAGNWDGDTGGDGGGYDSLGVFRPSEGSWFLRNTNTAGPSDIIITEYGTSGDLPVAGDWDGNGTDTIGIFRPSEGSWFLRNTNTAGASDVIFTGWGVSGDRPVAGDWNDDHKDTVGVFRPSNGSWFLHNQNAHPAGDVADISFNGYGIAGDWPVAGTWEHP